MARVFARALLGCVALLCVAGPAAAQSADGWRPLFNGRDLSGWRVEGGKAAFEAADNTIRGVAAADGPNTFLVTAERFSDFIFEAEMRIEGELNSGIMFRADARQDYRNGVVHGYQAEADPSPRRFSGGIYDEQGRDWLYPVTRNDACRAAFRPGGWNHYRIEAIGADIRTWVNRVPCARLVDEGRAEGFFGLQVHGVENPLHGAEGDVVQWRGLRVRTDDLDKARWRMPDDVTEISYLKNRLTPHETSRGWELLFDGNATTNWRSARGPAFPARGWRVRDGALVVEASGGGEAAHGGDIITRRSFANFELQVDFMISEGANSGIKYFVDPDLLQGEGSAIGLEFQILDDARHPDAKMGVAGNRTVGSLYDLIPAENGLEPGRKRVRPPGQWNRARILVQGGAVEHWLNDFKVVEYDRHSQIFRALVTHSKYAKWPRFGAWENGPILLQDHGDEVAFQNIKIRVLD